MSKKTLLELVQCDKSTLKIFLIYSVCIGLLTLIVPIAAQTLVTVVAFGTLTQPLLVLTVSTFVLLSALAFFRIGQSILVEKIQQRIFAFIALDIASLLPKIKHNSLIQHNGSHLVNRFFDTITVQKATSSMLIYGLGLITQILFGMVLLACYHPYLLLFDVLLLLALGFCILWPMRDAIKTACAECEEKHNVAAWLEEIVNNLIVFKLQNNAQFAYEIADSKTKDFLVERKKHFRNLLLHSCGIHLVSACAVTGLLAIGGFLVMHNQLTLGQLVAAEIVVGSLAAGLIKLTSLLEDFYDLLASGFKLRELYELDTEYSDEDTKPLPSFVTNKFELKLDNVNVTQDNWTAFKEPLNITLQQGAKLVVTGKRNRAKLTFLDLLMGFLPPTQGYMRVNDVTLNHNILPCYRQNTFLLRDEEIFAGTLLDNIILGNTQTTLEEVYQLITYVQMEDDVMHSKYGVQTNISDTNLTLSRASVSKLLFLRAIVAAPKVLIVDGLFDSLGEQDIDIIFNLLDEKLPETTLIVASKRKDVKRYFEESLSL